MEEECVKAETEHFRTDTADREKIVAGHWECTAMRKFFERLQKAVIYETNEALKMPEEPPPPLDSIESITGLQ